MIERELSSAHDSREELIHDLDRRFRRPLISYFAKRLRVDHDADDLVQEVFMRLTLRGSLEGIDCLDAFVFQTAANVMRDRFRRQAVRRVDEHDSLEASELPTNDFSPERVLQSKQLLDKAFDALSELPARTRDIFVLRLYEGLKLADIARNLGMSVEGVRFHLRRAKAHLARALEQSS